MMWLNLNFSLPFHKLLGFHITSKYLVARERLKFSQTKLLLYEKFSDSQTRWLALEKIEHRS